MRWLIRTLLVLALLCPLAALGEDAREITADCVYTSNGKTQTFETLRDGDLSTYLPLKEKGSILEIRAPEPMGGISVMLFDRYGQPLSYEVQVEEGDGWRTLAEGGEFLAHWHVFPEGTTAARICGTSKERLRIAELRVFTPGEPPADVQRWERADKADLMLITAHPDDEMLWFGGLLPTYAGERGLQVQVVVLVPTGGERKLELLCALWHCGVKNYPELLDFLDKNMKSLEQQYKRWRGRDLVMSKVVRCVRRYRPEVLVTHGVKGEYGHMAHKAAADVAIHAYKTSGSSRYYTKSVNEYGAWQVKKLYLHEYDKHPIELDWTQPLAAFGGKTGYEVASEAFLWHHSQVARGWEIEVHGKHDNALFGLYATEVGQDTGLGDLMEHIP